MLAYVAQEAVQHCHWLSAPEMLSGLGLAETTPGPLILVLQFEGFLAGYRAQAGLSGIGGGIAASALTLWVTFLPCFTFVFLGAPLLERLQNNRKLAGALGFHATSTRRNGKCGCGSSGTIMAGHPLSRITAGTSSAIDRVPAGPSWAPQISKSACRAM